MKCDCCHKFVPIDEIVSLPELGIAVCEDCYKALDPEGNAYWQEEVFNAA